MNDKNRPKPLIALQFLPDSSLQPHPDRLLLYGTETLQRRPIQNTSLHDLHVKHPNKPREDEPHFKHG